MYCKTVLLPAGKVTSFTVQFLGMEEPSLSPEQCRAARALLAWSQDDLSAKAKVAPKTLQLFETGQRDPYSRTLTALRSAFEKAGVVFIAENGGGPGVRLRKKGKR
jgi:DNA-binding XRE family transcriptional regulator